MNTIGETINNCRPEVKDGLKNLFDIFGDLKSILLNKDASKLYFELMIYVVDKREVEVGNAVYDYDVWRFKRRSFNEILKDYGGTIVMPF